MSEKQLLWRDTTLCTILTTIVAGLLYLAFVNISFLNVFTKAFQDFEFTDIFYSKSLENKPINKNIILVNIGKSNREDISNAIRVINNQNPKVIAVDAIFKELKSPKSDSLLKNTLKSSNVVYSYYFEGDSMVQNHNFFKPNLKKSGYLNVNPADGQKTIRDAKLFKTQGGDTLFSFVAKVALASKAISKKQLKPEIPIDYSGNIESFIHFDIAEVLNRGEIPIMKNAIVLLGYLGTPINNLNDIEDKHYTPMNSAIAGKAIPDTYGIVIHANVLQMLLENKHLFKVSKTGTVFISILICFLSIFVAMKFNKRNPFAFEILLKIFQFILSIIFVYMALVFLKLGVLINITLIIGLTLLGLELINIYKSIMQFFKEKYQWRSYLLD